MKIDKLDVLKHLYGEIYIPEEVFNEIEAGKTKEYYTDLSEIDWINIVKIKDKKSLSYFLDLDKGEAETIILATELNANLTILDERLGRFHARHAGLSITGTLGVLLKAKKSGFIAELKPLLHKLKDKGIWLSNDLIERTLTLAKEK